jgi:hypothetical protein
MWVKLEIKRNHELVVEENCRHLSHGELFQYLGGQNLYKSRKTNVREPSLLAECRTYRLPHTKQKYITQTVQLKQLDVGRNGV